LTSTIETIGRKEAHEYLAESLANRNVRRAHVNDLIGRQLRGEWMTNGDTIRFDSGGNLRDGQHRLMMVANTGIPITVVVVRGISPDAFHTMDTGRGRSLADVFTIEGRDRPTDLAGAVEWVWRYLSNRLSGSRGSHEQMRSFLGDHLDIQQTVVFCSQLAWNNASPSYKPILRATHYLFTRSDRDAANNFTERLVTGLRIDSSDDPVGRLRNQLIGYEKPRKPHPNGVQIFGICVSAWNVFMSQKAQKIAYKLPAKRRPESPAIAGFPKELFLQKQPYLFSPIPEEEEKEGNSES